MRLLVELVLLLVAITSITDVVHARTNQWLVSITSVSSNQSLVGGTTDGAPRLKVPDATAGGDNDHQWIIQDLGLGGGIVSIRSVGSGFYLNGRATGMEFPLLSTPEKPPNAPEKPPQEDEYLQWVIRDAGAGYVALQSVSSKGYLDGRHPLMENPLLVRDTAKPKEDSCQQWVVKVLSRTERIVSIQSLSSKHYLDGRDTGYLQVLISPPTRDPFETNYFQWVLTMLDVNQNLFSFKSVSSGQYLTANGPSVEVPWLAASTGKPSADVNLKWFLSDYGLEWIVIKSWSSSRFLNGRVPGIQEPSLTEVTTTQPNRDLALQWYWNDVTSTEPLPTQP